MSTIEEKALLNLEYEMDFLGNDLSRNMVIRAYVKGSADQKAIDEERIAKLESFEKRAMKLIEAEKAFREHLEAKEKKLIDNACKWLEKNSPDIEYITNASAYRQSKSEFIDTFRKAMEEEL